MLSPPSRGPQPPAFLGLLLIGAPGTPGLVPQCAGCRRGLGPSEGWPGWSQEAGNLQCSCCVCGGVCVGVCVCVCGRVCSVCDPGGDRRARVRSAPGPRLA